MKRLLWKEHRESWPYGIAMVVSSVLVVMLGTAYTFQGEFDSMPPWCVLPAIVAMIFGASMMTRAKNNGARIVMDSLNVNMNTQMLIKVILAFTYFAVATAVSLMAYIIICRPEYRPFMTVHILGTGYLKAIGITTLAWYIGFGLSVFSSLHANLHLLLWALLALFLIPPSVSEMSRGTYSWWGSWTTWVMLCIPCAVLLLNMHVNWRSEREDFKIGLGFIMVAAVIIIYGASSLQRPIVAQKARHKTLCSISLDGNIALYKVTTENTTNQTIRHSWHFINTETTKPIITYSDAYEYYDRFPMQGSIWISSSKVMVTMQHDEQLVFRIIDFSDMQHPTYKELPVGSVKYTICLSKTADAAIMVAALNTVLSTDFHTLPDTSDSDIKSIRVLDVRHAKWLTAPIKVRNCWWQSDRSVGYIDTAGKRRILPLPG